MARLVECEGGKILDATCGLGSDSLALAAVGQAVVLADADGLHVLFARANLERAGYAVPAVHTRAEDGAVRAPWLLIDPDRRAEGGERSLDPGRWSPTLDASLALAARARGACIKLAPSFEPSHELEREGLLEWISVRGELCEVCLWTGRLAGEERGRRAVVLGRTGTSVLAGAPEERELSPLDPAAAREVRWISEPDPAVIRAGLVALLARDAHLRPLGPRLAYLGGETPCPPGLAKSWRVVGSAAADVRNVRRLLAEHDVGPIVVKKRGHPDSAETLARRFRGRGSRRGTLIVARLARGHQAYLVEDAPATEGAAPGEEVGDEGFEPPTSSL